MDSKKIQKALNRFFAWLGLSLCSLIIKCVPKRSLYGFAHGISVLGYAIASKQRKIALDSLEIAFGKEKTKEEMERIARDCFIYMAKSAVELLFFLDRPALLKKQVVIAGRENLEAALGGENFEIEEMYPAYIAVGNLQEEKAAVTSMQRAFEAEKIHANLYTQAKSAALCLETCCQLKEPDSVIKASISSSITTPATAACNSRSCLSFPRMKLASTAFSCPISTNFLVDRSQP